jgi:hypothetical protein
VYVAEVLAARTVENLRDNGQIAVTFSRPLTHYSIQVKGAYSGIRAAGADDLPLLQRYQAAYTEQLHAVGLPRAVAARLVFWPSLAIDFSAGDLFVQTPGPSAGRRLEP